MPLVLAELQLGPKDLLPWSCLGGQASPGPEHMMPLKTSSSSPASIVPTACQGLSVIFQGSDGATNPGSPLGCCETPRLSNARLVLCLHPCNVQHEVLVPMQEKNGLQGWWRPQAGAAAEITLRRAVGCERTVV